MRKQDLHKKRLEGVQALKAGEHRGRGERGAGAGAGGKAKEEKEIQHELQKAGRKKLAMDALALGIAAVGMYNVRIGWQRAENVRKGRY